MQLEVNREEIIILQDALREYTLDGHIGNQDSENLRFKLRNLLDSDET